MASLSITQRPVRGHGWTDSPALIYPSYIQTGFVNKIITARNSGGDERASSDNSELIMEMLNDETVLTQEDRWRYVVPDELVKVETGADTAFAIRELACEALLYGDPDTLASAIPSRKTVVSDYSKEKARKFLTLAHRINELRKLSELHYRHVHKIHYVYEDHAGYTLSGADVAGGYVNYREYIGAIRNIDQLTGTQTIQYGEHFIDYTMPPTFREDRTFSPSMFTGVKLNNPNVATKYQVPILNRVFPDLNVKWIGEMPDVSQLDINANLDLEIKDVEPTTVQAAHINELRKAMSAYACHMHEVVLQTVDMKPLQIGVGGGDGLLKDLGDSGTSFGVAPDYQDVRPPFYLKSLGDCLTAAQGGSRGAITKLGREVPLYHHVYYNGKTNEAGLLDSLKGLIMYSDFQTRYFTDNNYADYYLVAHPPLTEDAVMIQHLKLIENLVFSSLATDNSISLGHASYTGTIINKAPDDNGDLPAVMLPIPLSNTFSPVTVVKSTTDLSEISTGGPLAYPIGTGLGSDLTAPKFNTYEVEGLLGNTGYIKVAFIPNILDTAGNIRDSLNAYGANKRSYILSYGQDNCVGTNWTPGIAVNIPDVNYTYPRNDDYGHLLEGTAMNLFVAVPKNGDDFKREVYNSCSSLKFTGRYKVDKHITKFSAGTGDEDTKTRAAFASYGVERKDWYAGTGNGRGICSSTDAAGNQFYYREETHVPGTREEWTPIEVHQSMKNLIEIWLEPSQFMALAGFPQKDLYTIHACISDYYGGVVMHLCGDVIINDVNKQDVWEVELSFDLRPGKKSQLAAGCSRLEETDVVNVNLLTFSAINNTVLLENLNGGKTDDLLVVVGTTNPGTFRIRQVLSSDSIEVTAANGAQLNTETLGAPTPAKIYRYKEIGQTKVLCETTSGDPMKNDSLEGLERYCYSACTVINKHMTEDVSRFWHTPRTAIDSILGEEHHYFNQEIILKKISKGDQQTILDSTAWSVPYLGYKSPQSQLFGFYRGSPLAPFSDMASITIADFNSLSPITDSNTGKTVVSFGYPICGLNLDRSNKVAYGKFVEKNERLFNPAVTLRRPMNDAFDLAAIAGNMVESNYNDYSGHFPITDWEAVVAGPYAGGVRFLVRTNEVSTGNQIRILFGDTQSYHKEQFTYTVWNVTNLTTSVGSHSSNNYSYSAQWVYVNIPATQVSAAIKRCAEANQNNFPDFSLGEPALLQIVGRPVKYIPPSYQMNLDNMLGGLSFTFKSITISTDPVTLADHAAYGYKYDAVNSRRLHVTGLPGSVVTTTPDTDPDHSFNMTLDTRSPLLDSLNHSETIGVGDIASMALRKIIDVTKIPAGNTDILTSFTNGLYQADGYNIKQLKGAGRNPATGERIIGQEGDLIRATDINELYNATKWLQKHTHLFSFTHATEQPIFSAD